MPFPAVTVRAVDESLNPWGFVIKSLDFFDLRCYDDEGMPDQSSCTKTKGIRKDFRFLFDAIINKFEEKLSQITSELDLSSMKNFPEKEKLNYIRSKDIKGLLTKRFYPIPPRRGSLHLPAHSNH